MPDNEKQNAESSDKPRALTLGEHLRSEREQKGLSTEQVAQHLLVDTWIVEALEANNFSALGAPVFAKGHLRKYAAMLGLPADELMMEYYQAQDQPDQPPLVARYRSFTKSRRLWPWFVVGIAILVAAGFIAVRIVMERAAAPRQEERSDAVVSPERPVGHALELTVQPTLPREEQVSEDRRVLAPPPAVVPETEAAGVLDAREVAVEEPMRIRLTFTRESWAEIYDANKTRLMYGMGRPNSIRVLSGIPPVQVFLGFADGVEVEVDGERYQISADDRRGNTARFRLESLRAGNGG